MLANTVLTLAIASSAFALPSFQRINKRADSISSDFSGPSILATTVAPAATGNISSSVSGPLGTVIAGPAGPSPSGVPVNGSGSGADELEQASNLLAQYIQQAAHNDSAAFLLAQVAKNALDLISNTESPTTVVSSYFPAATASRTGGPNGVSTAVATQTGVISSIPNSFNSAATVVVGGPSGSLLGPDASATAIASTGFVSGIDSSNAPAPTIIASA